MILSIIIVSRVRLLFLTYEHKSGKYDDQVECATLFQTVLDLIGPNTTIFRNGAKVPSITGILDILLNPPLIKS